MWMLGKSTIAVTRTHVRLYVAWDVEKPSRRRAAGRSTTRKLSTSRSYSFSINSRYNFGKKIKIKSPYRDCKWNINDAIK